MSKTISSQYLKQQRKLHENPNYGVASLSFAPIVADLIKQTGCKSLSDYGAGKTLSDGRNAHLIQKPNSWWLKKLTDRFEILHLLSYQKKRRGIRVIVIPKQRGG